MAETASHHQGCVQRAARTRHNVFIITFTINVGFCWSNEDFECLCAPCGPTVPGLILQMKSQMFEGFCFSNRKTHLQPPLLCNKHISHQRSIVLIIDVNWNCPETHHGEGLKTTGLTCCVKNTWIWTEEKTDSSHGLSIGHFILYVCCLYSNYSNILAEMTTGCSLDS